MYKKDHIQFYGFLGIGQFGGNVTKKFEEAGYPCVAANSSVEDLATRGAKNKFHFRNGQGCHKDRKKSKALLKENLELLIDEVRAKMPAITTLFICASSAGGTGSGMLAAVAKILSNQLGINICIVTVLPDKSENFQSYANTVELFQEIEKLDVVGATFILDNSRNRDKLKINEIFFTHLDALLTNENGGDYGCMDRSEIDKLLSTPGMAIISKLGKDNMDKFVSTLTSAALDGANYISNRNSATLTDIADATRVSASFAAEAGVQIDELTAAEATMVAATKRSGSEMGRAFRSILLNLQQVSGEFDGEVIDEEQLKKVEKRVHDLGVELEVMGENGAELRNPMQVLKELSQVYNSLPDNSADKRGLISDLGGKYHANALAALLSRWDMYEKMLSEFSQGSGSSLTEAMKTADSWEGKLNKLQNSLIGLADTVTDQNIIKGGITFFDGAIQSTQKLIDKLGAVPVLLASINAALTALNKDYGLTQLFNYETSKERLLKKFKMQNLLLKLEKFRMKLMH